MRTWMYVSVVVLSSVARGADYAWLSRPAGASWLGEANWDLGVWTENAANTATIGASDVSAIDVNGTVALAKLTVDADAALTNGTLALNGPFVVGAGATATVDSTLRQTDTGTGGTRFDKQGAGTLVLTGTNEFHRLRVSNGLLHFRGGSHDVVGSSSSPAEANVIVSLARGAVRVDDGAVLSATNSNSYFSNSGADLVVSNATVKMAWGGEFLNGFKDNNALSAPTSTITVDSNGVFQAGRFRLSKGTKGGDYGVLRVNPGGTIRIREFSMDSDATPFKAVLAFDGAYWDGVSDGLAAGGTSINRLGPANAETNWKGVTVGLGAGGLHYRNQKLSWFYKPITNLVERDGGVRFSGASVTYWWAQNAYNGPNVLEGGSGSVLAINGDRSLGATPTEPTDNVFFNSNDEILHFGTNVETDPNRNFVINGNRIASVGAQNGNWGRIRGTFSCLGTTSVFRVSNWWTGWTELCPPEGRTNVFWKMNVQGALRIGSGTTLVTQNCGAHIDAEASLYIEGNGSSFGNLGNLTVTGGVLRVTQADNSYSIIKKYGQVNVTGGLFDNTAQNEFIVGLGNSPGRATVSGSGELRVNNLRVSQSTQRDAATGLPVCEVNVCTGGVVRLKKFYIDEGYNTPRGCLNLNGGTVVARENNSIFLGTVANAKSYQWTNILARVCAGGAIFDTTNFNITVNLPLNSGAEADGGLAKKGAGTLTLTCTNGYNGATCLAGGKLVFAHADGYPGGHLDLDAATLQAKDASSELVQTQRLWFRDGCKVRVRDSASLDEKTYGRRKVVAKLGTALSAVPALVLLDADGNETSAKAWKLYLEDGGKTLLFGASRGTVMIFR